MKRTFSPVCLTEQPLHKIEADQKLFSRANSVVPPVTRFSTGNRALEEERKVAGEEVHLFHEKYTCSKRQRFPWLNDQMKPLLGPLKYDPVKRQMLILGQFL